RRHLAPSRSSPLSFQASHWYEIQSVTRSERRIHEIPDTALVEKIIPTLDLNDRFRGKNKQSIELIVVAHITLIREFRESVYFALRQGRAQPQLVHWLPSIIQDSRDSRFQFPERALVALDGDIEPPGLAFPLVMLGKRRVGASGDDTALTGNTV